MAITGKNNISIRKKDVTTQKSPGVGFVKTVFAHKATGGETQVSILSLTDPAIAGFVQPSPSAIQGLDLFFNRNNLSIQSTLRGPLMDRISYDVRSSSIIVFNDFALEADEILFFTVDPSPKSGLLVVDGQAIVETDSLGIGETDFAVSPFEWNKYPSRQLGAVKVYRDGLLQARCVGNSLSGDGNYIEVEPNGGTLSSIIRFKVAPTVTAEAIIVTSNGLLAERPSASQTAVMESLSGQVDKIVDVLAPLASLPKTDFQANPNQPDLRNFGDRLLATEKLPTIQRFLSGAGNYVTPSGCKAIRIRLVGAGGGGTGNGGTGIINGTNGGDTTFGSLVAGGGAGTGGYNGGIGGTASGGNILNVRGGPGQSVLGNSSPSVTQNFGGAGGNSAFGGGGVGGTNGGSTGGAAEANSGGGGGGGGTSAAYAATSGGGAGAYCEHMIYNPDATYAYSVGEGGIGGVGTGAGAGIGGPGGRGILIVEEYY